MSKISFKKPPKSQMCPVGYHVVRGHWRICESGTRTWVDAHNRKNRGRKAMYLSENLLREYWHSKSKFNEIPKVVGFPPHHELDPVIQFWLEYWSKRGVEFPPDLTPLHIKVLIALESTFNPKARPKTSSAVGLMQVLATARSALKGTKNTRNNEVRDNYISVSEKQLENPVINIAVGTRWIGHKYFLMRNHKEKSLRKTLRNYHSKDEEGDVYAEKIIKLYEKSKKQ